MPSCLSVVTQPSSTFTAPRAISYSAAAFVAALPLACHSEGSHEPALGSRSGGALDAGLVVHEAPTGQDAGAADAGGAAAALDPTLACIEYMRGLCARTSRCYGEGAAFEECMLSARFCPDVMYAPGSTRTVEGTWACAEGWRDLACDALPSYPPCATPGTRADGEPCIAAMQCASLACSAYGDACGVCSHLAADGEACDEAAGTRCDEGLYCDGKPSVGVPLPVYSIAVL